MSDTEREALARLLRAAAAVEKMLPHGPDRYELTVAAQEIAAGWRRSPQPADGNRPLPFDRDQLGRFVREAWVRWAQTQPSPKPSWLVPYDELNEADKEADRQIGEAVARWTLIGDAAVSPRPDAARIAEIRARLEARDAALAAVNSPRDAMAAGIDPHAGRMFQKHAPADIAYLLSLLGADR